MKLGVVGITVVILIAVTIGVVIAQPFESNDPPALVQVASPTSTARPTRTPATHYVTPTPYTGPCPRNNYSSDVPLTVNDMCIPLPPGASSGIAIVEPGGAYYIVTKGDSLLGLFPNGWIGENAIAPEDSSAFAKTLDFIAEAADPATVAGVSVRIPRAIAYRPVMLIGGPPIEPQIASWIGPPEESPQYHVFKSGDSVLSFDIDGNLAYDLVQSEDVEDFQPILDALLSVD